MDPVHNSEKIILVVIERDELISKEGKDEAITFCFDGKTLKRLHGRESWKRNLSWVEFKQDILHMVYDSQAVKALQQDEMVENFREKLEWLLAELKAATDDLLRFIG